jgi:hypothetical protein
VREFLERVRNNDLNWESGQKSRELNKYLSELDKDLETLKLTIGSLTGVFNAAGAGKAAKMEPTRNTVGFNR